jgi:hypothetical protein
MFSAVPFAFGTMAVHGFPETFPKVCPCSFEACSKVAQWFDAPARYGSLHGNIDQSVRAHELAKAGRNGVAYMHYGQSILLDLENLRAGNMSNQTMRLPWGWILQA